MSTRRIPVLVLISALFVFGITNAFSYFLFDHIPHVHDEICYVFQAKIFSSGRVYVPSPCSKGSFDFPHMINNGKWYSQYPPGFPLLITPFLVLGISWLINPLLASFAIFVFYYLGKEIYNERVGVLSSILGAVSIWFLLMSSTMMSHTACMVFVSLFLLFCFRSLKSPTPANGLLAGIGFGIAFLCRPYTAILMSIPIMIYYGMKSFPRLRITYKNVLALAIIAFSFVLVFFLYNYLTNGHPLLSGYTVRYGQDHGLGFGRKGFTDTPLTPLLGATNIFKYLVSLNEYLFGWPLSSFLAFFPLVLAMTGDRSEAKKGLLLLSTFFCLLFGYFFYWATILLYGPRFLFEAMPVYILLSARGASILPKLLTRKIRALATSHNVIWKGIIIIWALFSIHAFSVKLPRLISPKDDYSFFTRINANFHGVSRVIHEAIVGAGIKKALVVLQCTFHPLAFFPDHWWGSGFVFNDPLLKNDIIYAQNKGNIRELLTCFPERNHYIYVGTIEKGVLRPIGLRDNKIEYGPSITNSSDKTMPPLLAKSPLEFHRIYSPEFENFLKTIYEQNDLAEVNVSFLLEKGRSAKEMQNFREASFYFEAALQIEKNPEAKFSLLSELAPCYLKIGLTNAAKTIMDRLLFYSLEKRGLHDILPERGF